MTTRQVIEKAIEGESDLAGHYQNDDGLGYPSWTYEDGYIYFRQTILGFGGDPTRSEWKVSISEILLSPGTWQAVGKVEGWSDDYYHLDFRIHDDSIVDVFEAHKPQWHFHMHRLIDALAEGTSVDTFLATL
jgi:hypothetical protein